MPVKKEIRSFTGWRRHHIFLGYCRNRAEEHYRAFHRLFWHRTPKLDHEHRQQSSSKAHCKGVQDSPRLQMRCEQSTCKPTVVMPQTRTSYVHLNSRDITQLPTFSAIFTPNGQVQIVVVITDITLARVFDLNGTCSWNIDLVPLKPAVQRSCELIRARVMKVAYIRPLNETSQPPPHYVHYKNHHAPRIDSRLPQRLLSEVPGSACPRLVHLER